jgi:hypothetical protein
MTDRMSSSGVCLFARVTLALGVRLRLRWRALPQVARLSWHCAVAGREEGRPGFAPFSFAPFSCRGRYGLSQF